jgi:hypothetical protein
MENGTEIKQKRYGVRMAFRFDEDKLIRSHADHSGENRFSVPYGAIDVENPSTVTVNVGRRYTRLVAIVAVLAVIMMLASNHSIYTRVFSILGWGLVIALGAINYFKVLSIKYTVLRIPSRTGAENIKIIHDDNHDLIYSEILARWRKYFKKLYGAVDHAADPNKELTKFRWLKDHSIITELEYQDAVTKINSTREPEPNAERKDAERKYIN